MDSRGLSREMRKCTTSETREHTTRQDDWSLNCFDERTARPGSRLNFAIFGSVLEKADVTSSVKGRFGCFLIPEKGETVLTKEGAIVLTPSTQRLGF